MFLTPLRLEASEPGLWVLLSPLIWDGEKRYEVPAGFVTDLASIPRAFRWLLQQNGGSRRAAVLHDYLYRNHLTTRAEADALFRKALKAEGVNPVGGFLYWAGVRIGGWTAY
jgi:hypothetical protein